MKTISKDKAEYLNHLLNALQFEVDKAIKTGTFSSNYMNEKITRFNEVIGDE
jgi:ribosomal protein S20